MQVSKGLATWAGIVATIGQYAATVAVFLNDPDKATAAAPLATATATLIVVIVGRMGQAKAALSSPLAQQPMIMLPAAPELEPGDPDALPEYQTEVSPAPDEGEARP